MSIPAQKPSPADHLPEVRMSYADCDAPFALNRAAEVILSLLDADDEERLTLCAP